jgi:hypothetical protein
MRSRSEVPAADQCTEMHGNEPESNARATAGATWDAEGIRSGMPDDLRSVVSAWPDLPEALKAGILAMVRAAGCAKFEQNADLNCPI